MITSITDQIRFQTADLPEKAESIRAEVREFLDLELSKMSPVKRSHSWEAYDPDFSAKLGEKGFIGMTLPTKYGGHGKTCLLSRGYPTGAVYSVPVLLTHEAV